MPGWQALQSRLRAVVWADRCMDSAFLGMLAQSYQCSANYCCHFCQVFDTWRQASAEKRPLGNGRS